MSRTLVLKLDKSEARAIRSKWAPQVFQRESPLFYSGQVPNLAFLLTEGQILIQNEYGDDQLLKPLSLIGLSQLLKNIPSKATATICSGSKVSLIDKASLVELLETNKKSIIRHLALCVS